MTSKLGKIFQIAQIAQIAVVVLALIGISYLGWSVYERLWKKEPQVNVFKPAPQAPATRGITPIALPAQVIYVYPKATVSKKTPLPPAILDNPAKEILASATVAPSETKTTALAVLDTATGKSEIYLKREPQSFAELLLKGRIGTRYLQTNLSETQVVSFVELEVLRVSSAHVSLYAESGITVAGRSHDPSYWKTGVQLHYNYDLIDLWKKFRN